MDAGAAFDILSIQLVKSKQSPTRENIQNYINSSDEIRSQIGGELFNLICASEEFENLKDTNEKVFEAVSKAKNDEIPASTVDTLNYQRFIKKGILQKKFFSSSLTEQKIGYE